MLKIVSNAAPREAHSGSQLSRHSRLPLIRAYYWFPERDEAFFEDWCCVPKDLNNGERDAHAEYTARGQAAEYAADCRERVLLVEAWGEQNKGFWVQRAVFDGGRELAEQRERESVGNSLRGKALDLLGPFCRMCRETDLRTLQIDHVFGGGAIARREMSQYAILKDVLLHGEQVPGVVRKL